MMDLHKKYPFVKSSRLVDEWTTSVPFKTRLILDHLDDVTSNEKKIEIITNVLNKLKEVKQ